MDLAEPELAQRMRILHDIFGAVGPQPAERLSVFALSKRPASSRGRSAYCKVIAPYCGIFGYA
jgi:hypothetical protein